MTEPKPPRYKYMYLREEVDGPITDLMRIVVDETGLYGEEYFDGEWFETDYPIQFVMFPPEWGDYISEFEAMEIIASGVLDSVEDRGTE